MKNQWSSYLNPKFQTWEAMPYEELRAAVRDPRWFRELSAAEYSAAWEILKRRTPLLIF